MPKKQPNMQRRDKSPNDVQLVFEPENRKLRIKGAIPFTEHARVVNTVAASVAELHTHRGNLKSVLSDIVKFAFYCPHLPKHIRENDLTKHKQELAVAAASYDTAINAALRIVGSNDLLEDERNEYKALVSDVQDAIGRMEQGEYSTETARQLARLFDGMPIYVRYHEVISQANLGGNPGGVKDYTKLLADLAHEHKTENASWYEVKERIINQLENDMIFDDVADVALGKLRGAKGQIRMIKNAYRKLYGQNDT